MTNEIFTEEIVRLQAMLATEIAIAASKTKVMVAAEPAVRFATLAVVECEHIRLVMDYVNGNKSEAVKILDIDRGTLYRKLALYQNKFEEFQVNFEDYQARLKAYQTKAKASAVARAVRLEKAKVFITSYKANIDE